jgi:zinc protease
VNPQPGRRRPCRKGRRAGGPLSRRVAALLLAAGGLLSPQLLEGQDSPPAGRAAAEALTYPELDFTPPRADVRMVGGVEVFHLHEPALPLVDVFLRVRGGFGHFPREHYAAFIAMSALLRGGGTRDLPPDSVDVRMETLALQTSFGGGGGAQTSSVNTLRSSLDQALDLWMSILLTPRFDEAQVEVWRGQELEAVRRRLDDPGGLAYSQFNRLLFGDHPVGWEMTEDDLSPERFNPESIRWAHARVFCRENLMLGVAGAVTWEEIHPRLEAIVARWPSCSAPLPQAPEPEILEEPGVWLVPRPLPQSTIVLAHPVPLRQEDSADFASSRIANLILGGGGFSSRLMTRVRIEQGFAYAVSSLWTTPERYDGLVGATLQTGSGTTVAAVQSVLEVLEEMRESPPRAEEVGEAVDAMVNGWAFNFQESTQVVARQMAYRASGLPDDWLTRYLDRIQEVTPDAVRDVVRTFVRPQDMTILIVGDPEAFDLPAGTLGPVRILEVGPAGRVSPPSPRGSPQSRN